MLQAIFVAFLVLIFCIVAIVVFFRMRAKRSGEPLVGGKGGKDAVASIDTFGVNTTLDDTPVGGTGPRTLGAGADTPNAKTSSSGHISDAVRSRFVAMGVLAAGIFGTLTAKLWSMQVLAASSYESQSEENKYSKVATPAPRGYIYDADGVAIVKNRSALTVLADADVADDHDVVQRLSTVLGIPYNVVRSRILDTSSGAQSQRVVASDARMRDVAFIAEHSDAFSGVTIQERSIRSYPYGALAAHVVGYTGSVSESSLANMPSNRSVQLGDDVGQSGVEATYDEVLAGEHGIRTVMADADGNVVSVVSETHPSRGSDVYLTIKAPVQYVAENALKELIAPSGIIGEGTGVAGAVVAMDVTDGSIVAMASYPTFNPETFIGGISQDTWDLYESADSYYPLLNRCISGTYPAASTFKSFTGLAALKYGFADTKKEWVCTGSWDGFGSGDIQKCWLESGHGPIDFHEGIVQSCDVVFYEIAYDFYYAGISQGGKLSDTALQEEVEKYGFGKTTGIDLSGEEGGRVPTPTWKAQHWADVPTEGVWRGGDLTNMVIGQGDVLVTPLQIAVAYGGIATGTMMKPHLLKEVRNSDSTTPAVVFSPQELATPDVDKDNLETVRDALHDVAAGSSNLVAAFNDAGVSLDDIACKTGTGEVAGKDDYAWFACYMPFDKPKYVCAVLIEQGGGGASAAGPIGAKIMGALKAYDAGELPDVGVVAASSGESVEYGGSSSGRTD